MDVEGTKSLLLLVLTASLLGLLPKVKPRALLTQSVIPALSGLPWLPTPTSGVALLSVPFSADKQKSNSLTTELGRPPVPLVVVRLSLLDMCLLLTATAEAVMLLAATSAIAVTMATIANVVVLFAYIVIDIHTYLL
jgi:hypothetical protein